MDHTVDRLDGIGRDRFDDALELLAPATLERTGSTVWVRARTVSLTRTSPTPASAQSRAAMLTGVPT